eukprot:gene15077-237_t
MSTATMSTVGESAVAFMKEQHQTTLFELRAEIALLRQKNADLTMSAALSETMSEDSTMSGAPAAKKAKTGGEEGNKLWGGRFTGETDPVMEAFNASIGFDKRMWKQDIAGSKAYVKALQKISIVSAEECAAILDGLTK